jgi:hypothetical protein
MGLLAHPTRVLADSTGVDHRSHPRLTEAIYARHLTRGTTRGVHAAEAGRLAGPYPAQVVWQVADRWFGVSCDLDRAGILGLAERVCTEPNPVLVPFRLTSVPDAMRMTQLIQWVDGGTIRVSALFEQPSATRRLTMEVANRAKEPAGRGPVEAPTINGREVEVRPWYDADDAFPS